MRILILGGTLFIGRRIARELLARGDDVMVAHRGQTEPVPLTESSAVLSGRYPARGGRVRQHGAGHRGSPRTL
jgi:nucleoside-diphosphate-sugar epimerase